MPGQQSVTQEHTESQHAAQQAQQEVYGKSIMHFVVKRQEQLLALFIFKGIKFFLGWSGAIRNQPTRGEKILCKSGKHQKTALRYSRRGCQSMTEVQPNTYISQAKSIC